MRPVYLSRGTQLLKTPSYRQQATRRRLIVVCGILALALASGLIGSTRAPTEALFGNSTGPFSYFPSE